jgi:hypothetical protein
MLGLALREHAECRKCGGVLAETIDPQWSWKAQDPIVCLRCYSLGQDEERHAKSEYRGALIHRVVKKERMTPAKRRRRKGG